MFTASFLPWLHYYTLVPNLYFRHTLYSKIPNVSTTYQQTSVVSYFQHISREEDRPRYPTFCNDKYTSTAHTSVYTHTLIYSLFFCCLVCANSSVLKPAQYISRSKSPRRRNLSTIFMTPHLTHRIWNSHATDHRTEDQPIVLCIAGTMLATRGYKDACHRVAKHIYIYIYIHTHTHTHIYTLLNYVGVSA